MRYQKERRQGSSNSIRDSKMVYLPIIDGTAPTFYLKKILVVSEILMESVTMDFGVSECVPKGEVMNSKGHEVNILPLEFFC